MKLGILAAALGMLLVLAASGCTQQPFTCDPPYIAKGNNCCLDQNSNKVCDSDESGGGTGGGLIKNYRAYEVKMYLSQVSPEPDSWSSLPPNPAKHYDGYQIYTYPQDDRYYDGGWFILYTNYSEEPITCRLTTLYDTSVHSEENVKLTKKGFSGNVTGVTVRALIERQDTPWEVRYRIDCRGDESGIGFQDAYAARLKPP